jgi:transposase
MATINSAGLPMGGSATGNDYAERWAALMETIQRLRAVLAPKTKLASVLEQKSAEARNRVLDVLIAAAEAGAPCPSNLAIAAQIGAGESTVERYVRQVAESGAIRISRKGVWRVVTVTASGEATAAKPHQVAAPSLVEERAEKQPERKRWWSDEEIATAAREVRAGKSDPEIAKILGRSVTGVWDKTRFLRRELAAKEAPAIVEPVRVERFVCQNCGTRSDASIDFGCAACLPMRSMAA